MVRNTQRLHHLHSSIAASRNNDDLCQITSNFLLFRAHAIRVSIASDAEKNHAIVQWHCDEKLSGKISATLHIFKVWAFFFSTLLLIFWFVYNGNIYTDSLEGRRLIWKALKTHAVRMMKYSRFHFTPATITASETCQWQKQQALVTTLINNLRLRPFVLFLCFTQSKAFRCANIPCCDHLTTTVDINYTLRSLKQNTGRAQAVCSTANASNMLE